MSPTSELREHMARRAEEQRQPWLAHVSTDAGRAHLNRVYDGLAASWRSDEPMDAGAWELPDWARDSIPPGVSVTVLADGTVEVPALPRRPRERDVRDYP